MVVAAAFSTRLEWQDMLHQSALPLQPTPLSQALSTLQRDGVVRIDGCSVDPSLCASLRKRILKELDNHEVRWNSDTPSSQADKLYVPGTRLRFTEPIDIAFGGNSRHDLLLPLSNPDWSELQPDLRSAVQELQSFLVEAANQILPRLNNGCNENELQEHCRDLEIVELASLIARTGCSHQNFHGDYRRFHGPASEANIEPFVNTQARIGKLPPRLVTFVALQDIPTKQHGATGFVTGTNDAQAHEWVYEGQGISLNDESNQEAVAAVTRARQSILDLSLTKAQGVVTASEFHCGDMLVYDASVLHWGGPNSVANNDRAMLYFGVAHPGAAEILSNDVKERMIASGYRIAPPVMLRDVAIPKDSSRGMVSRFL